MAVFSLASVVSGVLGGLFRVECALSLYLFVSEISVGAYLRGPRRLRHEIRCARTPYSLFVLPTTLCSHERLGSGEGVLGLWFESRCRD